MKIACAPGRSAITASRISAAVTTRATRAPNGGARSTGPLTIATSAPRRAAAWAIAYPIFPDDPLERYRTGSIGSRVGPAATTIFLPARERPRRARRTTVAAIVSTPARRPMPISRSASHPDSGSITVTPRDRSVPTALWVAGCSHIRVFMAGATMTGAVTAR